MLRLRLGTTLKAEVIPKTSNYNNNQIKIKDGRQNDDECMYDEKPKMIYEPSLQPPHFEFFFLILCYGYRIFYCFYSLASYILNNLLQKKDDEK